MDIYHSDGEDSPPALRTMDDETSREGVPLLRSAGQPEIILSGPDIRRGLKLWLHAQHVATALLVVARFSSLPENYSSRDRRSFVSKKSVMGALVSVVVLYTIILYSDTGTAFAILAALQLGWPKIKPWLEKIFAFCQSWVNGGLNAVGIMEATEESADYVMVLTGNIDSHRAKLLAYKDQSKHAKLKRALKNAARTAGTLAVTIPPTLAAPFLEPEEPVSTQAMTVVISIPSQYFACADTFAFTLDRSAIWNAVLDQIVTNLRILQNDLGSSNNALKIRGNKTIRELLEYLPYIPKNATQNDIEEAIHKALNNGNGIDVIFKLLTMHGDKNHRRTDGDASEYVIILQDPMSKHAEVLSTAAGAIGAIGAQGFSHAAIKGFDSMWVIVPLFALSAFANGRLGWKGGKGTINYFYDLLVRGQKGVDALGDWFSQRKNRLGRFFGNIASFGVMGIGLGSFTALFSWGTNYLANMNALNAFFNHTGMLTSNNTLVVGGRIGLQILGGATAIWSSSAVNLKFYLLLFLLAKTSLNLYYNGSDRTQRNTQFIEQAQLLVKRLREMPEENVKDMLAYLAQENPEFSKIAIALCNHAGINENQSKNSGLLGDGSRGFRSYQRNNREVKFVWESAYRNFGNRGVNFYELPDISTLAPNLSPDEQIAQHPGLAQ